MIIKEILWLAKEKFSVLFPPKRDYMFNLIFSTIETSIEMSDEQIEQLMEYIDSWDSLTEEQKQPKNYFLRSSKK